MTDDDVPPGVAVPERPAVPSRPPAPAGAPTTDDKHSSSHTGHPWNEDDETEAPPAPESGGNTPATGNGRD